jgi:hypothetical protein
MTESFWSRMQVELLDRRRWRTRLGLAKAIVEQESDSRSAQNQGHTDRRMRRLDERIAPISTPAW